MKKFTELHREEKRLIQLRKAFVPKFFPVDTLEIVAQMINKPHIDDQCQIKERTERTAKAIGFLCDRGIASASWFDAKQIHSFLWKGLNPKNIRVGDFRKCDVRIGSQKMPRHEFLPDLIDNAFPVSPMTELNIVDWYRTFESIHPFEDGNGRVGGIIVAAISYIVSGRYLAPRQ